MEDLGSPKNENPFSRYNRTIHDLKNHSKLTIAKASQSHGLIHCVFWHKHKTTAQKIFKATTLKGEQYFLLICMAEKGENNPKPTRRSLRKKEYIQFAIQETS